MFESVPNGDAIFMKVNFQDLLKLQFPVNFNSKISISSKTILVQAFNFFPTFCILRNKYNGTLENETCKD